MKSTPDEILSRFASKLACEYNESFGPAPFAPSASVLPHYLSSFSDFEQSCSFPCLSLKIRRSSRVAMRVHHERERDDIAVELLGRTVHMGKKTVALAPAMLLRNVMCSFGRSAELGLQHALYSLLTNKRMVDQDIGSVLSSFSLTRASPICPVAAETKVLSDPFTDDCVTLEESNGKTVVVPLRLQVSIDVSILGEGSDRVTFGAPGTMSGVFTTQKNHPDSIVLYIDTKTLNRAIKKQCCRLVRHVVNFAVAKSDQKTTIPRENVADVDDGTSEDDCLVLCPQAA